MQEDVGDGGGWQWVVFLDNFDNVLELFGFDMFGYVVGEEFVLEGEVGVQGGVGSIVVVYGL